MIQELRTLVDAVFEKTEHMPAAKKIKVWHSEPST